jgi:spore maturation protein SpmB
MSPELKSIVRDASPKAFRTIWWIFKITAIVSFVMFLLKYTGILCWIATAVSPVFRLLGLPGDASMGFVSGYFINVYSCIAVISSLDLTAREITILGAMTLAAHAMIVECAVQKKTGTPIVWSLIVRTVGSILLGVLLNLVLPGKPSYEIETLSLSETTFFSIQGEFLPMFKVWILSLSKLTVWMTCLIYLLNIIQRALYEYGIMDKVARSLSPLLKIFGLPQKTAFLWIVANIIGLSYGSAALMDEVERGNISRREIDLLNTHIGISHSNLEDLLLFASLGASWLVILFSRWIIVTAFVWALRTFFLLSSHFSERY